jgi:RNA polymerase sigma-70 factor, ECF subfamily
LSEKPTRDIVNGAFMDKDATLIGKILQKDKHALYVFYKTYNPQLLRFVESRISNPKDAEEILQDTLFGFLEAARDFAGKSSIKTFLFSIANHKIIDFYRRKKIKHLVFSQVPQLETLISPLLSPEDELETNLLKKKINRVFNTLLPQYKTALLFKYMDDLSVSEIADKLAVSVKGAESILFRARRAFTKAFVSI